MVVAALVAVCMDVATLQAMNDGSLMAVRTLAGFAQGVLVWGALVWGAVSLLLRAADPDRLSGLFMLLQTLAQAAIAALLAFTVLPRLGIAGGFVLLAVLTLGVLMLVRWQPERLPAILEEVCLVDGTGVAPAHRVRPALCDRCPVGLSGTIGQIGRPGWARCPVADRRHPVHAGAGWRLRHPDGAAYPGVVDAGDGGPGVGRCPVGLWSRRSGWWGTRRIRSRWSAPCFPWGWSAWWPRFADTPNRTVRG